MLSAKQDLTKIMFLDLETTTITDSFFELPEKLQYLFKLRFKLEIEKFEEKNPQHEAQDMIDFLEKIWSEKGVYYPEFGKIVSIATGGFVDVSGESYLFRSKNLTGNDEVQILNEMSAKLKKIVKKGGDYEFYLCAHNGKTFDFPFLAKRMIINRIELPACLDYSELKPWEANFLIDTRDSWKYGVFDAMFSLDLICAVLGVESSKSDMHGSKVKEVFYKDKDYKRIGDYCEADIMALATCYLRMKGIYNNVIKQ